MTKKVDNTTITYAYQGDKLTSYNGQSCVYDAIGNPTTYRGKTATWTRGRKLTAYDGNTFSYNATGRRLTKNSIKFYYDSEGNLLKQSNGPEFFYGADGLVAIKYSGNTYLCRKDMLGNILALLDSSGNIVVQYKYDAWGNHTVTDANGDAITDANHIGNLNPFRYRGYYFDSETGFYFLQTRYYDPEVGRFLNMDSIEYADPESVNGINLYAYCGNNPVMGYDPDGSWDWLRAIAVAALAVVAVAAIAAITVATGGAATPVIAGAVIGAGISGASSAVSQLATTGEVQWEQVLVDASIGAVSGAFGGSAIGVGGMTVASFATGAAGSLASDWVAEEELDFAAALTTGAMSAVFTAKIGMGGVQYGKTAGHIAAKNTLKTAQRQWVKGVAGAYKQKQAYKSAQTALKSAKNILKQSSMFELTSRYAIGGHIVSFGSGFLLGLL